MFVSWTKNRLTQFADVIFLVDILGCGSEWGGVLLQVSKSSRLPHLVDRRLTSTDSKSNEKDKIRSYIDAATIHNIIVTKNLTVQRCWMTLGGCSPVPRQLHWLRGASGRPCTRWRSRPASAAHGSDPRSRERRRPACRQASRRWLQTRQLRARKHSSRPPPVAEGTSLISAISWTIFYSTSFICMRYRTHVILIQYFNVQNVTN